MFQENYANRAISRLVAELKTSVSDECLRDVGRDVLETDDPDAAVSGRPDEESGYIGTGVNIEAEREVGDAVGVASRQMRDQRPLDERERLRIGIGAE